MAHAFETRVSPDLFAPSDFNPLAKEPRRQLLGTFNRVSYSARIVIPDYGDRIAKHYADYALKGLAAVCAKASVPFDLPHFGLEIKFSQPVEIPLHTEEMVLDASVKELVARFGAVIFTNALLDQQLVDRCHRNIFPHLRFHVDRGPAMENQYSCFTRDPRFQEQRPPRASSTLFVANIVAWLENAAHQDCSEHPPAGMRPSYNLFHRTMMDPLLGNTILEQAWSAPEGTGEICVIDNRTVLHATYHKDGSTTGYPIGARYLY